MIQRKFRHRLNGRNGSGEKLKGTFTVRSYRINANMRGDISKNIVLTEM